MSREYQRTAAAVWELTLRCNLACRHCGSRAGAPRPDELSTREALDVVAQLAEVGVREVGLIGGEAFLRPDWLTIAAAITRAGMLCTLVTGGYGISATTARRMREAGIALVAVSVDGLESTHDDLRGRPGSWRHCFQTLKHVRATGVPVTSNTQINRLSAPELPALYEHLRDAGVVAWQLQLTGPMGNAADHPEILLQPPELLDLFPVLARVARRAWREGMRFLPAQNVGYYGPYERLLRSGGDPWGFWTGPTEGIAVLGIEADGTIKADPTLPTAAYAAGNVRQQRLREIIETSPRMRFNLGAGTPGGRAHLWGFCATCEFAELCRGGDAWTAHAFFARPGNHPYCHHRATVQQRRGTRERLTLRQAAPGVPFGTGIFDVVEEPFEAAWPVGDVLRFTADRVTWPEGWPAEDDEPVFVVDPILAQPPEAPGPPAPGAMTVDLKPGLQRRTVEQLGVADGGRPGALLPLDAWPSKVALLRALFRTKRALDEAEAAIRAARIPGATPQVTE